jgi:tricorn protease-like protein
MKEKSKVLEDIKKAQSLLRGKAFYNEMEEYSFNFTEKGGVRYVSTEDLTNALITARQSEDIGSELGTILIMLNT